MALLPCRECGTQVSNEALSCPHCGAPWPTTRDWKGSGFEWVSQTKIFGIPLVHVAFGRNQTGETTRGQRNRGHRPICHWPGDRGTIRGRNPVWIRTIYGGPDRAGTVRRRSCCGRGAVCHRNLCRRAVRSRNLRFVSGWMGKISVEPKTRRYGSHCHVLYDSDENQAIPGHLKSRGVGGAGKKASTSEMNDQKKNCRPKGTSLAQEQAHEYSPRNASQSVRW